MAETLSFSEVFASMAGVMPLAIRVGDAVYAWRISSQDPASGASSGGPVAQIGQAVKNMQAVLEAAGLKPENVARATGYIRDPGDREVVYEPWDALYPDPQDRPAFKVLIDPLPEAWRHGCRCSRTRVRGELGSTSREFRPVIPPSK